MSKEDLSYPKNAYLSVMTMIAKYGDYFWKPFISVNTAKEFSSYWYKELIQAGVLLEDVSDFTTYITSDRENINNKSPLEVDISDLYSEYKEHRSKQVAQCTTISSINENESSGNLNDFEYSCQKSFTYFSLRYNNLFKRAGFKNSQHYQFWREELQSSGLTSKAIDNGLSYLKNSTNYLSFPPSISVFIFICMRSSLKFEIIDFSEALDISSKQRNIDHENIIVRAIRDRFTQKEIMYCVSQYGNTQKIESYYNSLIQKAYKGEDIAPKYISKENEDDKKDEVLSVNEVISILDKF